METIVKSTITVTEQIELEIAVKRLELKVDALIAMLSEHGFASLKDRTGGVELACEILPNTNNSSYVYKMAKRDQVPHRKINGRYEFSSREIKMWLFDGAPTPASEWAEKYRQKTIR